MIPDVISISGLHYYRWSVKFCTCVFIFNNKKNKNEPEEQTDMKHAGFHVKINGSSNNVEIP